MQIQHHKIKPIVEITTVSLNTPKPIINAYVEEIYRLGDSMNHTTNVKASMTTYSVFNETKIFDVLFNTIIDISTDVCKPDPKYNLILDNAWAATYQKGDYTKAHTHRPYVYSFVYFLNETNPSTPLIFTDSNFTHTPKKDQLIIFPSLLRHHVPKHSSDTDRIVIAGNMTYEMKPKYRTCSGKPQYS